MVKITVFVAYNEAKKRLKSAGIEAFGFEARQIIKYVTGYSNSEIIAKPNERLSPLQQTVYNEIMNKRENYYPLQYMLGSWSFYGLDFFVGEGVLVPRADTEMLVDAALEFLKNKNRAQVIDLCSGSGCIAISVAKNADCSVDAVEKYDKAFGYLKKNINKHKANVTAYKADIFDFNPDKKYDLLVCNPPYIAADEMKEMNEETSYEPKTALYGGEDGLMFYKYIAAAYKRFINADGRIMFESGFKQATQISQILRENGYKNIVTKEDYNGVQRVVLGTKQ